MRFRGDIEGLRGLAVTLVVLAHAGIPGLQGGFVGVDVFFVISGFLITGLLKDELMQAGKIRFGAFYARRARRLLPALAFMLLATMGLGLWLLPSSAWQMQAEGMRWASLWTSNVYFALARFGYFGPSSTDSLYLHTWSLGVEEQFYLIWPALLAVLWALGKLHALRSGVLLVVVVGFASAAIATTLWPVQAYYQTPFRLWQLAAGGLLHFLVRTPLADAVWPSTLRLSGFALLAVSCVWLAPARVVYPGAWALLPTIAALLLVVPAQTGVIGLALDNRYLRFLGRISYSWYLWHWPLMVIGYAQFGKEAWIGLAAGGLALLPAWLSWRMIESPRGHRTVRPAKWVVGGTLVSMGLAIVALGWEARAPANSDTFEEQERQVLRTVKMPGLYANQECDEWYSASRVVPCLRVQGSSPGVPVVVLIGDSVGAQWSPAFEVIARRRDWTFIVLTKSACPMLDRPFFYPRIRRRYEECERWRDGVMDYLHRLKPFAVIMGSTSGYGDAFTHRDWLEGTQAMLARLKGAARSVSILAPTPILPFDAPQCIASGALPRFPSCSTRLTSLRADGIIDALAHAAASSDGARLIDLNDEVCPRGVCVALHEGTLTYRDNQHLNAAFVEQLSGALEREIFKLGVVPVASSSDRVP